MLGYLTAAVMFAIATAVWVVPLARWKQFSRRSQISLMIAAPTISLCAALWVFAIVYSALGREMGSLANDASGHKTAIGRIFSIAFFSGLLGTVSSGVAVRNTGEPRLQWVAAMALVALGWWLFHGAATF
jgi:hypothetical protein